MWKLEVLWNGILILLFTTTEAEQTMGCLQLYEAYCWNPIYNDWTQREFELKEELEFIEIFAFSGCE